MRKILLRSGIISLVVIVAAAVSACSDVTSVVVGNGTLPPKKLPAYVVTRSHKVNVSTGSYYTSAFKEVSASCQTNEMAVGGGYGFDVDVQQLSEGSPPNVTESRPTGSGWTVGFNIAGAIGVTVYAQCLIGGAGSVSVQSASIDVPTSAPARTVSVVATCPAGTTDVGGGFSVRDGIEAVNVSSKGGGDFVNLSGHDLIAGATAYASCYSMTAGQTLVRDHRAQTGLYAGSPPGQPNIFSAYVEPFCHAGAYMTAGGYTALQGTGTSFVNAPNPDGTHWDIELIRRGAAVDVTGLTGELMCVTF